MTVDVLHQAEGIIRRERVMAYIKRIRNSVKHGYALHYGAWREYGGEEPQAAPGLSFMAAQAVRMQIDEIRRQYP